MLTLRVFMCLGVALCLCAASRGSGAQVHEIREREITFTGAGGVRLEGTLALPAAGTGAKAPGVILIAGSGPTDRDGNQGVAFKTDLLKQIADGLARDGCASLRYDKRVTGANRALLPSDPVKLGDFCIWENFVADAVKGFRCLQRQPEVDAARTGMLGHSEGSWIVLDAASQIQGQPNPCRALALVSTGGRTLDLVIHDQLVRALKRQQATPEQTRFFLDANDRIATVLKTSEQVPDDVPDGLKALYPSPLGKFLHRVLTLDPVALALRYSGPVLMVHGEKDVQESCVIDAGAMDAALRRRKSDDHTLFVVPGASHNLKRLTSDADPGFEGPVAPEALDKLGSWLKTKLGA